MTLSCSLCNQSSICTKMNIFLKEHLTIMEDPFFIAFLEDAEHLDLFCTAICYPSDAHALALDDAFRTYYANKQFLNYLSTTLYWKSVHYDQQRRKQHARFPPFSNEEALHLKASGSTENKALENLFPLLEDKISYPSLKQAYKQLTFRQKTVLHYIYGEGLLFYETAEILGITQQGVSSIHKQAIQKLRGLWKE
ncbi:sigma factor-like helix-turn-helix DNA-binding protein [Alkalicoccus daliensis]|uniref:RNA polymerase sigma factor, sigma-70 family n=1 Tax=Alkalicoccus daliensis TaxID=745820 RepID=A0A1H0GXA3_9BACI|nr:sigma factor-like helix-turn-helix DNA-binding protein [Alkalicoccus daliensis]SDO11432.1 RNA polymerase sigma factor, sigma-70 family [Alkalicoccus daliensis]